MKSGSAVQSLTARSVGEAEFYVVVKGCQVGLSLRFIYMDLGIQMKLEIQSDCSSANYYLTDRLGAGPRKKQIDKRYLSVQERVQDGGLRIKKVLAATSWNESGLCCSTTTALQMCRIGVPPTMDPTLHYKMIGNMTGDMLRRASAEMCKTERNRQM